VIVSLPLLLVAIVLAVIGVAQGSGPILVGSILASLLTAVTLAVSARHSAATRLAVGRNGLVVLLPPPLGSAAGSFTPVAATIPGQQGPDDRESERLAPVAAARTSTAAGDPRTLPVQGVKPAEQRTDADEDPPDEPPAQAVAPEVTALVAGLDAEVVVVDERPRYHLTTCGHLVDREVQALPVCEAIELGFTPCAMCEPDTALVVRACGRG
jgi:hypothetical protein